MGAEQEPAQEIRGILIARVEAGQRRDEVRIDGDDVGLLADLERADRVVEAQRPRAVERRQSEPAQRVEDDALVPDEGTPGHLGVGPDARDREQRQLGPARHVRPEADGEPGCLPPCERHDAGADEEVRRGAVRDPDAAFDQPRELAIREVDGVGEDRALAERAGAVVLLKGPGTVVASPEGDVALNPTGGAALATAGSGDVLTGIVAGFLARGLDPFRAAAAAAWVHGRTADRLVETDGPALVASDLVDGLGRTLQELGANP